MARDGLAKARSGLLLALVVEVTVLVVTGIALFFLYRPSVRHAWGDLGDATTRSVGIASALRLVHRFASTMTVWTSVALGVVLALRASAGRRWTGAALGAAVAVTAVLASFTGYLLPWDQLALWAVKVGTDIRGYTPLFGSQVRFVLIGGTEISPGTMLWWLSVHAIVLAPLLLGLLFLASRRPPSGPEPPPA